MSIIYRSNLGHYISLSALAILGFTLSSCSSEKESKLLTSAQKQEQSQWQDKEQSQVQNKEQSLEKRLNRADNNEKEESNSKDPIQVGLLLYRETEAFKKLKEEGHNINAAAHYSQITNDVKALIHSLPLSQRIKDVFEALISVESNGNPNAKSSANAYGLAQIKEVGGWFDWFSAMYSNDHEAVKFRTQNPQFVEFLDDIFAPFSFSQKLKPLRTFVPFLDEIAAEMSASYDANVKKVKALEKDAKKNGWNEQYTAQYKQLQEEQKQLLERRGKLRAVQHFVDIQFVYTSGNFNGYKFDGKHIPGYNETKVRIRSDKFAINDFINQLIRNNPELAQKYDVSEDENNNHNNSNNWLAKLDFHKDLDTGFDEIKFHPVYNPLIGAGDVVFYYNLLSNNHRISKKYNSDQRLTLALQYYNAGRTAIEKAFGETKTPQLSSGYAKKILGPRLDAMHKGHKSLYGENGLNGAEVNGNGSHLSKLEKQNPQKKFYHIGNRRK